jgi:hypothetical protein
VLAPSASTFSREPFPSRPQDRGRRRLQRSAASRASALYRGTHLAEIAKRELSLRLGGYAGDVPESSGAAGASGTGTICACDAVGGQDA